MIVYCYFLTYFDAFILTQQPRKVLLLTAVI